jgi:hypothetical protein
MKVTHSKNLKSGQRQLTVILNSNEELTTTFNPNSYYQLGGQVEDIVQGHVITEARCVFWCSIAQKWENC